MSNELRTEEFEDLIIVRFIRPEIRNPLSITVLAQLDEIMDECKHRKQLKTLIFTGSGNAFASGADLREILAVTTEMSAEFAALGQRLMNKMASLRQTTVAAINGYCFGGGLDLALSCDHRIATGEATFAHPGAGLGIITGWGGTQRLPRLVGEANALELFFTASPVGSDTALRIGLIDEIVETLDSEWLVKEHSKALS